MKLLTTTTCILAAAMLCAFTFQYRVDFSGTWKLNKDKSDLGEFGEMMVGNIIKIDQKSDRIVIAATGTTFDGGEETRSSTLTFDGKPCESTVWGSGKRKSIFKWSEDGKSFSDTFISVYDWDGEKWEEKGVDTWKLSEDGKTISMQSSISSSEGDMLIKAVYEKQ
jgi:hypothetical protein